MQVDELVQYGVPESFVKKFKEEKISGLYPPQADIVRKKLLEEKNLVLSLPTASGKTLIATLAMINKLSKSRCKVLYIVPLVALGYEKYEYYKKFFEGVYKTTISVGDFDSSDPWLGKYDIVIATSEKLDSLLRHGAEWVKQASLIIVDEVHLLNDTGRGPTLEILLTLLKEIVPRAQILALSATINNSRELSKWLNANLVMSDFRPIKLFEGVCYNSKIEFFGKEGHTLNDLETEDAILENTLQMKKQCLYFTSTRKSSESLSEKLTTVCKNRLSSAEKIELAKISDEILNTLEVPTQQCKRLAKCIKYGTAFHHAGLLGKQKRLIEDSFRKGLIKTIASTPTLALGVNLPAFRVIIRDARRYYPTIGSAYIPVLDYKQMVGRAGRPQYDSFGESILVAKSDEEARELSEKYILGEPEEIRSKLAVEPILRMHTLSLIASKFTNTEEGLTNFFSKTFYAFQYGDISLIEEKLSEILDRFEDWGFVIREDGRLNVTLLGKRVSELYIDPLTAYSFTKSLKFANKKETTPFSYLQTVSNSIEMQPLLSVRTGEFSEIEGMVVEKEKNFLQEIPEEWDIDFENFFKSIKTTMMLEEWINEATEDTIMKKYKVAPGELRSRLGIVDWLMYALHEIALLKNYKKELGEIRKVRIRMQYGVRGELMPLIRLEQVGRIRARKLWKARLRSLEDLRKVPMESLSKVVGPNIATIIKKQLGEKTQPAENSKQSTLGAF